MSVLLIFNASLIILAPSVPMNLTVYFYLFIYLFTRFFSLFLSSQTHKSNPIQSKVLCKSHQIVLSSSHLSFLFVHINHHTFSLNNTSFIEIHSFFHKPFTFITPVPLPPSSFFIRNSPTTFPPS